MKQLEENGGHPPTNPRETEAAGNCSSDASPLCNEELEPEHFTNPYARASQARIMGKRPQPLDHQSKNNESRDRVPTADVAPAEQVANPEESKSLHARETREFLLCKGDKKGTGATNTTPLMSIQEVANFLHVSVSTIQRTRKRNPDFPSPIRDGGSNFWVRTEIEAYLEGLKALRHSGH